MLNDLRNWFEFQREQFGEQIFHDNFDFNNIYDNFSSMNNKRNIIEKDHKVILEKIFLKKSASTVDLNWYNSQNIDELMNCISNCKECELGNSRKNFVFGKGNHKAEIMIIGEAPGADEDDQGEPFVGRAGQLLTKMLEAIELQRDDVFIANILKCRPPNNRRPSADEIRECEPYLQKQIEIIKPKLILVLGLTAVSSLLKKDYKMSEIRGTVMDYRGIKLLISYHPAALLRNPAWKKPAWEDLQLLKKMYDNFKV